MGTSLTSIVRFLLTEMRRGEGLNSSVVECLFSVCRVLGWKRREKNGGRTVTQKPCTSEFVTSYVKCSEIKVLGFQVRYSYWGGYLHTHELS